MENPINNNYLNISYDDLEMYNETFEVFISLKDTGLTLKDVLNVTAEPNLVKKYVYKAPLVENEQLYYGYKIKLFVRCDISVEFTSESVRGETKFISKSQLFNVSLKLPKGYEEGMGINTAIKLTDISHKIIDKNSLYLSTYLSFTISV